MPIGNNPGNQLNLIVFEVGILTTFDGISAARTVCVHPLVVVPSSTTLMDATRTNVQQSTYGVLKVLGGRRLRTMSYQGSFGVAERALGPYFGDGATRQKRFYNEVVRLAEVLRREDVAPLVDFVTGSIGLAQFVQGFNPVTDQFFVNLYDFLNGFFAEVVIESWKQDRAHGNGGATGLSPYQMTVAEVGPVVAGTTAGAVLESLLKVAGTWQDINRALVAVDATALAEMRLSSVGIPVALTAETLSALADKAAGAVQLMTGQRRYRTDSRALSLSGMMGQIEQVRRSFAGLKQAILAAGAPVYVAPQGQIPFQTSGEVAPTGPLDRFEQMVQIGDAQRALDFQTVAGAFYGMGRTEYQRYLEANGKAPGPGNAPPTTHTVTSWDTPATLSTAAGVPWSQVLALNGLTPDEALTPGTQLLLPAAPGSAPPTVEGLPVFGSHSGLAALGVDLPLTLETTAAGDIGTVDGADCLAQGIDVSLAGDAQNTDRMAAVIVGVPLASEQMLLARYRRILSADRRIASVDGIVIEDLPNGTGKSIHPSVTAITSVRGTGRGA